MKFNEELWNEFSKGKLVVNCKTEQEANMFLNYLHNKGIKWYWNLRLIEKSYFYDYEENTCYRMATSGDLEYENLDFYKKITKHKIITFRNLLQKQYSTWEIIKMYQEGNLNKNDIVIGKILKAKVYDLKSLGTDNLLRNEPFRIEKINEDVNILYDNIKILIKEDKLYCLEDVVENHLDIKTIYDLNKVLDHEIVKSYDNELDWN
ncbi:TPA: hypothetical protein N2D16_002676 [Clostridium botulinum]|nr:hypothetical protein [Clostridium botulinum]